MRVRPLPLVGGVFAAAALATWFVVARLPLEGQVSAPERVTPPRSAAELDGATPALPPPAAGDPTLEIRVTAGPEPQRAARVRIYLASAEGWRVAGEGVTSAEGVVRLAAPPGAYLVAARAEGLAAGHAAALQLAGREPGRADVVLAPPVELAGRVTAPGGAPLAGATIRAAPAVGAWGPPGRPGAPAEEIAVAEADASGAFRVAGVAPGWWALSVEAPGFERRVLPEVAAPCAPLAVALEPLARVEGRVTGEDGLAAEGAAIVAASGFPGAPAAAARAGPDGRFALALPAGSWRVHASLGDAAAAAGPLVVAAGRASPPLALRLGRAAELRGDVVHAATGRPAGGARVVALAHETGVELAHATADAAGRFRLGGLAAGAVDVRATADGTTPALAPGVTLAAGARFPLRLALEATGSAAGTVTSPAGRPLAGVRVRVAAGAGAPRAARTGFDGTWRVDGLAAGAVEVSVRQDGVAAGAARRVRVAPGEVARADLVLGEAGRLAGRVLRDGRPPPAGTVVLARPRRGDAGAELARTAVDAAGAYELVLPEGEYRVAAAPAGTAWRDLRAGPGFARIEAERTARLDLAAPAAAEPGVEILVLEPGGAPSAGASVVLSRAGDTRPAYAATADEDGRVALGREMGAAGRPAAIRARNGGRTGEAEGVLPEAGTVAVTLSAGGTLSGVVRARGRPVETFTLAVASEPEPGAWRIVDVHRFAGERFELADLPAGPLRVSVRAEDGRHGEATVTVGAGATRALEIALAP